MIEVLHDGGDELGDVVEVAPANALAGEFREPALDQIEPGATGGREVQMETGVALQARKASLAASTVRSSSAAVESGTSAITSRVQGFSTSSKP